MQELKKFNERSFAAGSAYDTEVIGLQLDTIALQLDGTVSGGSTPAEDNVARMLGTPEVVQAEQPLIRMEGIDWLHLSAITRGGYDFFNGSVSAGMGANFALSLSKIMPGAKINGAGQKVFVRGTFGALADYAGTPPTGIVGTLRPTIVTSEIPQGVPFRRPKFSQFTQLLETADSDIQRKVDFEQDLLVFGILIRAVDASADTRVDGLVRNMRADVNLRGSRPGRELIRHTWGQLRRYTTSLSGFNRDDITNSAGVVILPTIDPTEQFGGAFFFRAGESLTLHFDTSATVEGMFSAVTPATGDKVVCTILGFELVDGAGDQGPNSALNDVPRVNASELTANASRATGVRVAGGNAFRSRFIGRNR